MSGKLFSSYLRFARLTILVVQLRHVSNCDSNFTLNSSVSKLSATQVIIVINKRMNVKLLSQLIRAVVEQPLTEELRGDSQRSDTPCKADAHLRRYYV